LDTRDEAYGDTPYEGQYDTVERESDTGSAVHFFGLRPAFFGGGSSAGARDTICGVTVFAGCNKLCARVKRALSGGRGSWPAHGSPLETHSPLLQRHTTPFGPQIWESSSN
jgi:hypothetical protein